MDTHTPAERAARQDRAQHLAGQVVAALAELDALGLAPVGQLTVPDVGLIRRRGDDWEITP
ncbi:hypothetical protein ABT160_43650 [Streptomyces sp. NPDC001941]|uniref:hypothetical protein n=1 Tax=Streptomyces sp. NPDC001941 TaxID=3154659 RepID=UPI00331E4FE7